MVFFSKRAYKKIRDAFISSKEQYEVGGVLLGHKFGRIYIVVSATAYTGRDSSKSSFFLDGNLHTELAQKETVLCVLPLTLLGVWHSHTNGIGDFSAQDNLSNKQLARGLNGALSVLVTSDETGLRLTSCFISASGDEKYCKTIKRSKT